MPRLAASCRLLVTTGSRAVRTRKHLIARTCPSLGGQASKSAIARCSMLQSQLASPTVSAVAVAGEVDHLPAASSGGRSGTRVKAVCCHDHRGARRRPRSAWSSRSRAPHSPDGRLTCDRCPSVQARGLAATRLPLDAWRTVHGPQPFAARILQFSSSSPVACRLPMASDLRRLRVWRSCQGAGHWQRAGLPPHPPPVVVGWLRRSSGGRKSPRPSTSRAAGVVVQIMQPGSRDR